MGAIHLSLAVFGMSEESITDQLTAAEELAVDAVVDTEDSLPELATDDTDCVVLICDGEGPTERYQQLREQLSSLPVVVGTPTDDRETIRALLAEDDVEYVHTPADEEFPVYELSLRVRQLVAY